jgi:hypothetical protein
MASHGAYQRTQRSAESESGGSAQDLAPNAHGNRRSWIR